MIFLSSKILFGLPVHVARLIRLQLKVSPSRLCPSMSLIPAAPLLCLVRPSLIVFVNRISFSTQKTNPCHYDDADSDPVYANPGAAIQRHAKNRII